MMRFRAVCAVALLLSLPTALIVGITALAEVSEKSPLNVHQGPGTSFKLRVYHDEPTAPELVITDGFKLPPKVDSNLVQQIRQVRLALPSWHGLHGLAPGASSGGQ